MLFQKEKEDKNQINRLDQKEKGALEELFPAFPDKPENAFWKSIPVRLSEKASLTLETAMALPLFFSECSRCFLLWIFTRYRRSI